VVVLAARREVQRGLGARARLVHAHARVEQLLHEHHVPLARRAAEHRAAAAAAEGHDVPGVQLLLPRAGEQLQRVPA